MKRVSSQCSPHQHDFQGRSSIQHIHVAGGVRTLRTRAPYPPPTHVQVGRTPDPEPYSPC